MTRTPFIIAMLAIVGCGRQSADDADQRASDWCSEFYARFDASQYVNQRTGRLDRDPTTNEIIDPESGRTAVTRREEECVHREAQKAIDRFEGE